MILAHAVLVLCTDEKLVTNATIFGLFGQTVMFSLLSLTWRHGLSTWGVMVVLEAAVFWSFWTNWQPKHAPFQFLFGRLILFGSCLFFSAQVLARERRGIIDNNTTFIALDMESVSVLCTLSALVIGHILVASRRPRSADAAVCGTGLDEEVVIGVVCPSAVIDGLSPPAVVLGAPL